MYNAVSVLLVSTQTVFEPVCSLHLWPGGGGYTTVRMYLPGGGTPILD